MDNMKFSVSLAPHTHTNTSSRNIMLMVILALIPAVVASLVVFSTKILLIYAATILSCVLFETVFNHMTGRSNSIQDLSGVLTGLLLAMNLPESAPLWICIVGSFVAIVIAKMVFGGLGGNPFNPALVARVFLLISFPVQMTKYTLDGLSGATVLSSAKTYAQIHEGSLADYAIPDAFSLFLGNMSGSIGEVSAVALLGGGLFLLLARVITWHIPLCFIGTVFVLTFGHNLVHPDTILPPLVQIFSGGLMLGAFFMATDYVTTPLFAKGKIIFGVGCGVITVVIRLYGGYPEGVAFAILIMNAVTPLLDKYLRPRSYGEGIKGALNA